MEPQGRMAEIPPASDPRVAVERRGQIVSIGITTAEFRASRQSGGQGKSAGPMRCDTC
jgi:hypothetical protein